LHHLTCTKGVSSNNLPTHPPDLFPLLDHRGRREALGEEPAVLLGENATVQE
jgi:hypothetical protein